MTRLTASLSLGEDSSVALDAESLGDGDMYLDFSDKAGRIATVYIWADVAPRILTALRDGATAALDRIAERQEVS